MSVYRQFVLESFNKICRHLSKRQYSPCFYTWPFPAECAVELVESTNSDKDCRECKVITGALVTARHSVSHTEAATAVPLHRTIFFYLDYETIGTAATPGLLCQPRVIMKMIVESIMEYRLAGETEVLGENLPQRHFCPS
jgi:hypothetical protein